MEENICGKTEALPSGGLIRRQLDTVSQAYQSLQLRFSDLGLLDPDGDPDRHQHLITWSLSKKFRQNPFTTFSVMRRQ